MCWTPAPELKVTYSSIWDFFLPGAGSLMGILTRLLALLMTMELSAENSVLIWLSSTLQKRWKDRHRS